MLLGLLAATVFTQAPLRTVELSRGAIVQTGLFQVPAYTYWDTEDTSLDSSDPDASHGGEATLVGGPLSQILIRFGDLDRALGATRHVRKATLHLTIAAGDTPELASAGRLLKPWGGGPFATISATIARLGQSSTDGKGPKSTTPRLAATWRARQAGVENGAWQLAGAKGAADAVAIPNVRLKTSDADVAIEGLSEAVQYLADHPSDNDGILLSFSKTCEFYSAKAIKSRPRLEIELDSVAPKTGPDLSVISIERTGEGDSKTFTAHVKNVGDTEAEGFSAVWALNGRAGASLDHPEKLAAGAETTLTLRESIHTEPLDHRSPTVELRLKPVGPDASPRNDSLAVYGQGRRIAIVVDPSVAERAKTTLNLTGGYSIEDWLQAQAKVFNDVYLANSRYSFAPDGSKERISIQSIRVGAAVEAPTDSDVDATVVITPSMFVPLGASSGLLHRFGESLGLVDLGSMSVTPGGSMVKLAGATDRGTEDLYAGLMGGGDTRFDGAVPGAVALPYEPRYSSTEDPPETEVSGLLSMTDVYALSWRMEHAAAKGLPPVSPTAVLIRARDLLGRPVQTSLAFFQSHDGKIGDGAPMFTLPLNDSGIGVLPARESSGIFGKLDSVAGNGLYLVRATQNGVTEWSWIKAWQIIDAYARGNTSAAIIDLVFNLPGSPLVMGTNLAAQHYVTDATGQPSDKLAVVVDGDMKTLATLGTKRNDWIEVDLGRDRTIAEVRLGAPVDEFWNSFDIVLYGTGQRPQEGMVYARERNWMNARRNRSDGPSETATVAYRGSPIQIRYIRIVSRSGGVARISEVEATPAKISN